MPATATRRAPTVEIGTTLASAPERAADFEAEVAALDLDPAVFTGAFATNVWGGRYEIDGVIASGGQGTTFAGTDRKTGTRVAVKVFDLRKAKDWKVVDLFEREVATLKRLAHPQLPAFIDLLEEQGTGVKALVMTHMQGRSLQAHLQTDGPLSEAELWRTLAGTAEVLEVLHHAPSPIVHRDLKPANLIRRPDGSIGLIDFGGVGAVRTEKGSTVVGTFGYMAPEQLYGTSTPATDLYALGATLLTLATGTEPEEQPRKGLGIDVEAAAPRLSPALREVLQKLLAPDPDARPADARALRQELGRIAAEAPAPEKAQASWWWRKKESAPAQEPVVEPDDPRTEARWVDPADVDEAASAFAGALQVAVGILGTLAVVVLGEVLIPIVLTLIAAFSSGPTRRRLEEAREHVRVAAFIGWKGFERTIESGARALRESEHRAHRRRVVGPKDTRRPRGASPKEGRAGKGHRGR